MNRQPQLVVNVRVKWWCRALLWSASAYVRLVSRIVTTKGLTTAVPK